MKGKFITFEGGEGVGKSTQIALLADRLADRGTSVVRTREPGGTPAAEAIRALILGGKAKGLGSEAEALLFAAARADHVGHLIRPALMRGDWVLCDRFIDSSRVYQGRVGGVDDAVLDVLERVAVGKTRPDLTLILDVSAEVGIARIRDRRAGSDAGPDRFESDSLALHKRRRTGFLDLAAAEPSRCVVVDAGQGVEAVAAAVWRAVQQRLLPAAGEVA